MTNTEMIVRYKKTKMKTEQTIHPRDMKEKEKEEEKEKKTQKVHIRTSN